MQPSSAWVDMLNPTRPPPPPLAPAMSILMLGLGHCCSDGVEIYSEGVEIYSEGVEG